MLEKKEIITPLNPPKFIHVAYHIHQQLFQDGLMISGFYNWHRAFGGEFAYYSLVRDKIKDYDIIFVGVSKPELDGCIMSRIREDLGPNSKAIVVACVDYAVEMWQNTFLPAQLKYELDKADFIFASEIAMLSHLQALLPHRKIYHLIHPTDTGQLKRFTKPYDMRRNALLAIIHRYDNNWLDMYLATHSLEKETDVYAIMLDSGIKVDILKYFKYTKDPESYGRFIEFLSEAKVCTESYHRIHSYGRIPVECACLKVPVVSTDIVTSAKIFWPDTTVLAGDVYGQSKMLERLLHDEEFYINVTEKAYNAIEAVNYPNSVKRLIDMIEGRLPDILSKPKERS